MLCLKRACLSVAQLQLWKGFRAQNTSFSGWENRDCQIVLCLEVLKWLPVPKCNMDGHLEHPTTAAGVPPAIQYNQLLPGCIWGKAMVSLITISRGLSSIIQFCNHFVAYRQYCQMFYSCVLYPFLYHPGIKSILLDTNILVSVKAPKLREIICCFAFSAAPCLSRISSSTLSTNRSTVMPKIRLAWLAWVQSEWPVPSASSWR